MNRTVLIYKRFMRIWKSTSKRSFRRFWSWWTSMDVWFIVQIKSSNSLSQMETQKKPSTQSGSDTFKWWSRKSTTRFISEKDTFHSFDHWWGILDASTGFTRRSCKRTSSPCYSRCSRKSSDSIMRTCSLFSIRSSAYHLKRWLVRSMDSSETSTRSGRPRPAKITQSRQTMLSDLKTR